ncbi:3-isopropylmalate dehydrogenase [Terrisporobacter petrolearius]
MDYEIAVIKGDGVGPEITNEGIKILNKIGKKYNHNFKRTFVLGGGAAIDKVGNPLPKETLEVCKKVMQCCLVQWEDLNGII